MERYWWIDHSQICGANTGCTLSEMMSYIAERRVLADTLVSVNLGTWVPAEEVPVFQEAFPVNPVQQNQPAQDQPGSRQTFTIWELDTG